MTNKNNVVSLIVKQTRLADTGWGLAVGYALDPTQQNRHPAPLLLQLANDLEGNPSDRPEERLESKIAKIKKLGEQAFDACEQAFMGSPIHTVSREHSETGPIATALIFPDTLSTVPRKTWVGECLANVAKFLLIGGSGEVINVQYGTIEGISEEEKRAIIAALASHAIELARKPKEEPGLAKKPIPGLRATKLRVNGGPVVNTDEYIRQLKAA